MDYKFFLVLFMALSSIQVSFSQAQIKKVKGTVTDGVAPLQNVNVRIKENGTGVRTNSDGQYEIRVEEGQTLVYSHVGKISIEIKVEDVTRFLNVEMFDKIEQLDGVTVTKRKRKSQKELLEEYPTNKNLVKTSFGVLGLIKSLFMSLPSTSFLL